MVATIVLVVSNKPIQSSMNNTSLVVNSLMGTPPIEATSWWQAMMRWMGLIVAPEQTDAD